MKVIFSSLLLFICTSLNALHLLEISPDISIEKKQQAYHQVLMKWDYPMCLIQEDAPDYENKLQTELSKIDPRLKPRYVPTTLWQLFVLKFYFHDASFRNYVKELGYSCRMYNASNLKETEKFTSYRKQHGLKWLPNIDEKVVEILNKQGSSLNEIYQLYHEMNHRNLVCHFFLKINDAFLNACQNRSYDDPKFIEEIIESIPLSFETWVDEGHPFSCLSFGKEDTERLISVLKDSKGLIRNIIQEEIKAHQSKSILLFRGGELFNNSLLFYPIHSEKTDESYSFSYGNSFFGGAFISIDACAANYTVSQAKHYAFHALKVPLQDLYDSTSSYFTIPPISPMAEMLADGEWFHAHTKLGCTHKQGGKHGGFFAQINANFKDELGFIVHPSLSPKKLSEKLMAFTADHGIIFKINHRVLNKNSKDALKILRNHKDSN